MTNKTRLYAYYEDFYYGEISYLFKSTEDQIEQLLGNSVSWFDEVGKNSEGVSNFNSSTVKEVKVTSDSIDIITNNSCIPVRDISDIFECILWEGEA